MRVRAAACVLFALLATACSGKHAAIAHPESLHVLDQLSSRQSTFGVILDAKTGKALSAFRVNNGIRSAIDDGHGGWYIGGGFIYVNGQLRKRLAHIRADGTLDPDWRPETNGNGVSVSSLARIGSRLYVAGDFEQLDRSPRLHLGAIDARTGKLDDRWQPPKSFSPWNAVLLPAGHHLIVGDGSCCSEAGSSVVALDAETGAVDKSWRPNVDSATLEGGGVYLLVGNGAGILVGGIFRAVDGVRRSAIAEIDTKTGLLVRRWSPRITRGSCTWCSLFGAAVGRGRVYASINGPAPYPPRRVRQPHRTARRPLARAGGCDHGVLRRGVGDVDRCDAITDLRRGRFRPRQRPATRRLRRARSRDRRRARELDAACKHRRCNRARTLGIPHLGRHRSLPRGAVRLHGPEDVRAG